MICNFNPNSCSVDCKKYPICAFYSIQNQFSEIQSQLNFVYTTISDILKSNEMADTKISLLESAFRHLYDNSDKIISKKESIDEKEDK